MHRILVLIPLTVGVGAFASTMFIHLLPLSATISIVRREKRLGKAGVSLWMNFLTVAVTILFALVAHLIEIALWAVVFIGCGEFHDFGTAFYHSAVNYTTLGYGDPVMSTTWRLLGPVEAANGTLMFGVSTAMIFAVILRLTHARFVDLKD